MAAATLALALLGCGSADERAASSAHQAVALADQEDEVCGMLLREQSAPRSQLVHRDGSRFFFCSLGDMLTYLSAPSPHGRVEALFVEVMGAGEDPMQSHTGEHPWAAAEEATYLIGIPRPGIMGAPVLAYASQREAERAMQGHTGARMLDMAGLRKWWKATH
ncbi:MAG: nitrous oxide reductase accessory protein NosL [Deltaproteobacteria bacterium]|nr:nitrous oxide reductase accessory protein NosL [Deltaproteobacteria bacterium]